MEKLSTDICETNDTSKMWNLFKKHRENHEDKSEPKSPLVTPAGLLTESEDEICKEFSRHLRLVHQTPPNPLFDESFKDRIDNEMQNDESHRTKANDQSIENVGIKSFRNLLSLTKTKSAAGEDGITYAVMKLCTDETIPQIEIRKSLTRLDSFQLSTTFLTDRNNAREQCLCRYEEYLNQFTIKKVNTSLLSESVSQWEHALQTCILDLTQDTF